MRAILVDDERLARKRLATMLAQHPEVRIVGEANSVADAQDLIAKVRPNIIFLDIQMPHADGFELVPLLPIEAAVVFVTAYDQHALRAFEAAALDYLLKPVSAERLAEAVRRLRIRLKTDTREVLVGDSRNWTRIPIQEISVIQAEGAYTRVLRGATDAHLVRRSMTEWLDLLPPEDFVRASRSLLVNRAHIAGLRSRNRDVGELLIRNRAAPIPLGRTALRTLRSEPPADLRPRGHSTEPV
jgi:two-component system, LytTR family, response regulator